MIGRGNKREEENITEPNGLAPDLAAAFSNNEFAFPVTLNDMIRRHRAPFCTISH